MNITTGSAKKKKNHHQTVLTNPAAKHLAALKLSDAAVALINVAGCSNFLLNVLL